MASYAISSSMPAATAALLEHAMAGRAQAPHIGEQTSPYSLFIRYRISAQAEGIILASRLLLLCISGRGSRKPITASVNASVIIFCIVVLQ